MANKAPKYGTEAKCSVWLIRYVPIEADTHKIITAELRLSNVVDAEVLKQTRNKILDIFGDGTYETKPVPKLTV
ncbi:hypothetical protein AABH36_004437 [Vibrio parahaemolyticus]